MADLAYADDIVILSSSYSGMQGLLEAVDRHARIVSGKAASYGLYWQR